MILLKGVEPLNEDSKVSCTYTPSVKTYNITTENMSDDCRPFQLGNGCCIWLNEEDRLGEIECIYPKYLEDRTSLYLQIDASISGQPSFKLTSFEVDVVVEQNENGFIIWFSKSKKVEREVLQKEISYLFSGNELLGIVSNSIEIIE